MFVLHRPTRLSPLDQLRATDFSDLWAGADAMGALRGELHRLDAQAAAEVEAAIVAVETALLRDKIATGARLKALCATAFAAAGELADAA